MKPYAKKRFGQNFLIDPNILRKITRTIAPQPDDIIVEIGPGKGALTKYLAEAGSSVIAIEIDDDLIHDLEKEYTNYPNVDIVHRDALKFDYSTVAGRNKKLRVVGNIPYNISSPLLFRMFEFHNAIDDIHFLVQREIARRICAKPNSKEYGILSVITQFYGDPKIAFEVSPNVFRPIPEVTSALLAIRMKALSEKPEFIGNFYRTVRTAFAKRRKILRNTLAEIIPRSSGTSPLDLSRRAESLTVTEFIALTHWLFG
ncbi:MAG TPA: 16S rRNA (adenine(1518)-N(6)/adenine(1519)-N(6))-dimethyltransferase RsmA [Candidatus Marinimicrobia bacterium]|nr:16S rRNA (adenine(1518)-N(6)/adenine(1519)-N(6))-dimethyltransferase RsmA [Candidatus Neomarinimicrobiota bacterium]